MFVPAVALNMGLMMSLVAQQSPTPSIATTRSGSMAVVIGLRLQSNHLVGVSMLSLQMPGFLAIAPNHHMSRTPPLRAGYGYPER